MKKYTAAQKEIAKLLGIKITESRSLEEIQTEINKLYSIVMQNQNHFTNTYTIPISGKSKKNKRKKKAK